MHPTSPGRQGVVDLSLSLSLSPLCSLAADAFYYQNPPGSPRPKESERCSLQGQKRRKENSYTMRGERQTENNPTTLSSEDYEEYIPVSGTISQATTPTCSNKDFKESG